ncbi:unnamed protein product, partial [Brassica rapa]
QLSINRFDRNTQTSTGLKIKKRRLLKRQLLVLDLFMIVRNSSFLEDIRTRRKAV